MSAKDVLAVTGVAHRFRGLQALERVDLTLREGQCLGLVGPNGAGKSTFFRLIAGLLELQAGRVVLAGRDVTSLAPEARYRLGLGWAFQHARWFPSLTPFQHLDITGGLSGAQRLDRVRAEAWLGPLGLAAEMDAPLHTLTLAQRKLLDVARAACRSPRVLLLDEPYAGLAREEAQALEAFVRSRLAGGTTVLVVEHRIPELLRIVDEVAVLAGGRILLRGAPEETLRAPEVLRAYFGVGA